MNKFFLCCIAVLITATGDADMHITQRYTPQELVVNVNDARLFCRTLGKGPPVIVLHGVKVDACFQESLT